MKIILIVLTGIGGSQIDKKILSNLINIKIKSDYIEEYNDFQVYHVFSWNKF